MSEDEQHSEGTGKVVRRNEQGMMTIHRMNPTAVAQQLRFTPTATLLSTQMTQW